MAKYRYDLPQHRGGIFLTDGGLETTLIFHEGIDLPHFAAFVLLDSADGRQTLKKYYEAYLAVARKHGAGFVLDSATWRTNPDWADKLGYDTAALRAINLRSISLLEELRNVWEKPDLPCVISGAIGIARSRRGGFPRSFFSVETNGRLVNGETLHEAPRFGSGTVGRSLAKVRQRAGG